MNQSSIQSWFEEGSANLLDTQGFICTFKRKTSVTTTWFCRTRSRKMYSTVTHRGPKPNLSETLKCSARALVKEAAERRGILPV